MCVVEDGSPLRRAAERFQVARTTAKRWAEHGRGGRWVQSLGPQSEPNPDSHRTTHQVRVLRRWMSVARPHLPPERSAPTIAALSVATTVGYPAISLLDQFAGRAPHTDSDSSYPQPRLSAPERESEQVLREAVVRSTSLLISAVWCGPCPVGSERWSGEAEVGLAEPPWQRLRRSMNLSSRASMAYCAKQSPDRGWAPRVRTGHWRAFPRPGSRRTRSR